MNLIFLIAYKLKIITNKIEKKIKIPIFLFISPSRLITFFLERLLFQKLNTKDLSYENNGGYCWKKIDGENPINVISAGISSNIDFEKYIFKKNKFQNFICIDPTTLGENTIKESGINCTFLLGALFNSNGKIKIFKPPNKNDNNYSISNLFSSKTFEYINSYNIKSICEKYNIKKIDILKLDVEGVAYEILQDCILNNILPNQICFEMERPLLKNQIKYFMSLIKFKKLFKKKYKIYYYTNKKLGHRTELLCVKK